MAGLLGNGPDDPRSAAVMALAGGLLRGDFGGGLLGSQQAFSQAKEQALKSRLLEMQMASMQAEQDQRRAAMEQAQRRQQALPSLYGQQMSQGAFSPSADGMGPVMPQSAAPSQGFDFRAALAAGFKPEEIEKMANLPNAGRAEVARTIETMRNGRPVTLQFDKFGNPIGEGQEQWKAPVFQNLGDKTVALDPVSLAQRGAFAQGQSPDSKASNAVQWANHALSKQRLAQEQSAGTRGQFLETPDGYVLANPKDGSVQPVLGPDGQPLKGKAANRQMTDAQAKANLFGSRMQESHRILNDLEGKYSPMAVNAKMSAAETPGVGGAAGYVGNLMLSQQGQQAEQAQRDFINAVLRRESGAVISPAEFANGQKQYFPQPGDTKAVLDQKRRNRALAIQGMAAEVPGGLRGAAPEQTGAATGGWGIQRIN